MCECVKKVGFIGEEGRRQRAAEGGSSFCTARGGRAR